LTEVKPNDLTLFDDFMTKVGEFLLLPHKHMTSGTVKQCPEEAFAELRSK